MGVLDDKHDMEAQRRDEIFRRADALNKQYNWVFKAIEDTAPDEVHGVIIEHSLFLRKTMDAMTMRYVRPADDGLIQAQPRADRWDYI